MNIIVRPASAPDSSSVKFIEIQTGLSSWNREDYEAECMRTDAHFFVAETNAGVIGFVLARTVEVAASGAAEAVELYNLAVLPEFRRMAVASMLLEALPANAAITLEVRSSNHAAISFYQNRGFKLAGSRRNFYRNPPEDALIMVRR